MLALLALLAQALAVQASTGHLAGMLSTNWLGSQVCTGSGAPVSLADLGDQGPDGGPGQWRAQCPLCAVAVMPLLGPRPAPEALPHAPMAQRRLAWAVARASFPAPPHLLPPAQGPPAST